MVATTGQVGKARQRFSMSVQALARFVLLVAVFLGWQVNQAQKQRLAVARILESGGIVSYDWQSSGTSPIGNSSPWGPVWLRKWLGDEYFQTVTEVIFSGDRVADDSLGAVKLIGDGVVKLALRDCPRITDAGLLRLRSMTKLRSLQIDKVPLLTNRGLAKLGSLPKLESLSLSRTGICNSRLPFLKELPQLRSLSLFGSQMCKPAIVDVEHWQDCNL